MYRRLLMNCRQELLYPCERVAVLGHSLQPAILKRVLTSANSLLQAEGTGIYFAGSPLMHKDSSNNNILVCRGLQALKKVH